ncbi:MAG: hypothetical protein HY700_07795 [Gemmatimonadetes bacterium]|nr:hypothetical protein [Gemmatimonadota bacterium]
MRQASQINRALAMVVLVGGASILPAAASAQLAVPRSNQTFLILPPVPAKATDSATAVQLGDAIRKKVEGKLRLKLNVVKKEKMAEALSNSGFGADAILDEYGACQLARFMNVDAYMSGRLDKDGTAPVLQLRLVDARRSGLSGWITVQTPAGSSPEQVADIVADSVDQQTKAAEQSRECLDRRDKQDYGSARERAERAFRLYPNHPSAAMCVSTIFDARKYPPDSQVVILKKAVAGDSLLAKAWDGLVRQYQQKGDTAAWADAVIHSLAIDPTDMRKRLAAAELLFRLKQYPRSVELLDEGLERAPGEPQAISMRLRVCFEGQMWGCASEAMAQRYESDSVVRADSLFLKQLLAAAGATNDSTQVKDWGTLNPRAKKYFQTQPDKAATLKWTEIGVQRFPNSASFWRARAAALKEAGKTEEALAAYDKVSDLDPKDITSRIASVQILTEQVKIDSTVPLDTVKLARIDTLLSQVAANTTDENLKMNVAVLYFTPATKMVQNRVGLNHAISMLEKTKANDTKKQLTAQASFFEGLAYTFNLQKEFDFKVLQASKDCKQLGALDRYLTKMNASLDAGASVQAATVSQIKTQTAGIGKFVADAKKAWKCTF